MEITLVEESRVILERTETGRKETYWRIWHISKKNREYPREYLEVEQVGRNMDVKDEIEGKAEDVRMSALSEWTVTDSLHLWDALHCSKHFFIQ